MGSRGSAAPSSRGEGHTRSGDGAIVYLDGGDDLGVVMERIEGADGSSLLGKTLINDDIGHFALFTNSEGGRLALHSPH